MDPNTPPPATTDEYISRFPPEVQDKLQTLRRAIREAAPGAQEKISYGMPAFTLHGMLVWFAAHQHHIGFYPTGHGIASFGPDLAEYKTSKGAVQFPLDKPLPLELIARIVKLRVIENAQQAEAKAKKPTKKVAA